MTNIQLILELLGTIAFAISGANVGIIKKMDLLGVCILGLTTGVGGGVIRDLLLGITPPGAFVDPTYAIVAIITSLVFFFPAIRHKITNYPHVYELILLLADTVGLGLFTVTGVRIALNTIPDSTLFFLVFMGVLTGVGGGVLRDVFSNEMPFIFCKHFYAMASIIGALITAVIWDYAGEGWSMMIGAASVIILRVLAARYRWELPRAKE